jgi:hypothetical protein
LNDVSVNGWAFQSPKLLVVASSRDAAGNRRREAVARRNRPQDVVDGVE